MSVYSLAPIFKPQYIANGAPTALTLASGGTTVGANTNQQIAVMRVANVTGAPVTLEIWRVPSGASADAQHIVVPSINIPVATQSFPWFDITALWGAILQTGDAIFAQAGAASALVVQADGALITP